MLNNILAVCVAAAVVGVIATILGGVELLRRAVGAAQAGGVESATVVMEQDTGRSRGFGFVEMATAEEADAAVKKFNGQDMDGRRLKVELAKSGGAGGSGGYRSGGGRSARY